jgi:hypothetical protein
MSVQTTHISIDIRLDGDEISGLAGNGTDQPKAFQGWLGSLLALDGLLGNSEEESARSSPLGDVMELSFG